MSTTSAGSTSTTSGGGLSASDLIDQANEHWNVSGESILIAWLLTAVGSAVVLLIFSWRRLQNQLIFMPRIHACKEEEKERRRKNKIQEGIFFPSTPPVEEGFFGWLKPSWGEFRREVNPFSKNKQVEKSDGELLEHIGLDAVTFIQYLRMVRWMFTVLALVVAVPLCCINYQLNTATSYGSSNSTAPFQDLEDFTAANIQGNALYVHIAFEWIGTCIVMAFVIAHLHHHETLLGLWAEINHNEIAFKTAMVTNIPARWFKGDVNREKVVRDKLEAPETRVFLIQKRYSPLRIHFDYARKEERALIRHVFNVTRKLNDGSEHYGSIKDRLMGNPHVEGGRMTAKGKEQLLARSEKVLEAKSLAKTVQQAHNDSEASTIPTTAFVTFHAAKDAYESIKHNQKKKHFKIGGPAIRKAPRHENIIWENLEKDAKTVSAHIVIGRILLFIFCLINIIPVMILTIVANLNNLIAAWPTAETLLQSSPTLKAMITALSGVLPAMVSSAFGILLPIIMRRLSKWSGALSRGQLDKDVTRQLFVFNVFSNFIVFSLLGILYQAFLQVSGEIGPSTWLEIYHSLGDVPAQVTQAYITESSYWLSWYPVRGFAMTVELLQLPRVFSTTLQFLKVATPEQLREMEKPEVFKYAIEYAQIMLALLVGMVYTPLAPLVTLCAAVYFWSASIAFTHNLKFVEVSQESDGKMWRIAINRLLFATLVMQLLMCLIIGLKTGSFPPTALAAIPIGFTAFVKVYTQKWRSASEILSLHTSGTRSRKPEEFGHGFTLKWPHKESVHPDDKDGVTKLKAAVGESDFKIIMKAAHLKHGEKS